MMTTIDNPQFWHQEDTILFPQNKGANPEGKKKPAIKCPNCKNFLYSVINKRMKNDTLCYDLTNPIYQYYPRNHICVCSRCHHHIGVLILNPKLRKQLNIPLQHECHRKLIIE